MTTIDARKMDGAEKNSIAPTAASLTESYIQWLYNAPFTGWNSDPTQPCLLYKVYRDVPRIPLDYRFPLDLDICRDAPQQNGTRLFRALPEQRLAWLLYFAHGLTRIMRPAPGSLLAIPPTHDSKQGLPSLPRVYTGPEAHHHPFLGRPVPSGGNLHPVEIYIVIGTQYTIPAGVYHYNSVHHALDQLRVGNYMADIAACLPGDQTAQPCQAVLFPACFFQKNYQKYENMSYCLQNLDTGIVIEQLDFTARQFNFTTTRYLQFIDTPLHHLIGLDTHEECIYAAISLYSAPMPSSHQEFPLTHMRNHETEIHKLSPVAASYVQPFVPRPLSKLLKKLYATSLLDTLPVEPVVAPAVNQSDDEKQWLPLPMAGFTNDVNLAQVLLKRHTSFCAIDTRALKQIDLTTILTPLKTLEDKFWQTCSCHVYCVIRQVQGMAEGVYLYSREQEALTMIHSEEILPLLILLTTAPNIQPHIAPLNLFFIGDYVKAHDSFGERGLRLMGIAIGCAIQRITLAAAIHRLATHTHCSYLLKATGKKLLRLPSSSQVPFASMMLGYPKPSQESFLEVGWY
jgi:SagB-type dehydrogenase family enzyme